MLPALLSAAVGALVQTGQLKPALYATSPRALSARPRGGLVGPQNASVDADGAVEFGGANAADMEALAGWGGATPDGTESPTPRPSTQPLLSQPLPPVTPPQQRRHDKEGKVSPRQARERVPSAPPGGSPGPRPRGEAGASPYSLAVKRVA